MKSFRLPPYCLNISQHYVRHWKDLHGFRQLYQNFMDAVVDKYPQYSWLRQKPNTENGMIIFHPINKNGDILETCFISFDPVKKILVFENQKSFQIKKLLLGCTTKADKPETQLGQFGQGMKLAMLVLLKAGFDLTIQSGQYKYFPSLSKWTYNYQDKVLFVSLRQVQNQDKTRVEIEGITQQKFDEFKFISLALLNPNMFEQITFGKSTLIISQNPNLIGKIYKKGVRLQVHQSKENTYANNNYSFNLEQLTVGRDRDAVNNVWQLHRCTSKLHFDICNNYDQLIASDAGLKPHLKVHFERVYSYLSNTNYQCYYFHTYHKDKKVADKIYEEFLSKNKKTICYPVNDGNTANHITSQLKKYGLNQSFYPTMMVGWLLYHNLIASSKYQKIEDKINRQILKKQVQDLTDQQRNSLNPLIAQIAALLPQINEFIFKVKQIENIACFKDGKTIFVNRFELANKQRMKIDLIRLIVN